MFDSFRYVLVVLIHLPCKMKILNICDYQHLKSLGGIEIAVYNTYSL